MVLGSWNLRELIDVLTPALPPLTGEGEESGRGFRGAMRELGRGILSPLRGEGEARSIFRPTGHQFERVKIFFPLPLDSHLTRASQ
jgi:hypothetical protein